MNKSGKCGHPMGRSFSNRGRAVLQLRQFQGRVAILKNFQHSSKLFRYTCGAYMAHREVTAYRRLKGIDGVPRFLGRKRPDGLLLEYIEGHNCMEQHQISLPLDFFNRLQKVLNAIRNRGVLHGDIKRNVLATPTGNPVILDFGASFVIYWWLWPLRSMILAIGAQYDNREVVKIKQRIDPDLMTPTDIKLLSSELPFDDIVRLGEKLFSRLARWALRLDRGSVS